MRLQFTDNIQDSLIYCFVLHLTFGTLFLGGLFLLNKYQHFKIELDTRKSAYTFKKQTIIFLTENNINNLFTEPLKTVRILI